MILYEVWGTEDMGVSLELRYVDGALSNKDEINEQFVAQKLGWA